MLGGRYSANHPPATRIPQNRGSRSSGAHSNSTPGSKASPAQGQEQQHVEKKPPRFSRLFFDVFDTKPLEKEAMKQLAEAVESVSRAMTHILEHHEVWQSPDAAGAHGPLAVIQDAVDTWLFFLSEDPYEDDPVPDAATRESTP